MSFYFIEIDQKLNWSLNSNFYGVGSEYVKDGKELIVNALTNQGVSCTTDNTFLELANKIDTMNIITNIYTEQLVCTNGNDWSGTFTIPQGYKNVIICMTNSGTRDITVTNAEKVVSYSAGIDIQNLIVNDYKLTAGAGVTCTVTGWKPNTGYIYSILIFY